METSPRISRNSVSVAAGGMKASQTAGARRRLEVPSEKAQRPAPKPERIRQTFAIGLARLPRVDESPGLILLTVDCSGRPDAPRRIGILTDAALRGRLAHFDAHSANEIAAIRRALGQESGTTTVYETWSNLAGCVQFWAGFTGLQIRPIAWTCEKCGVATEERIGGSVGESFPRLCRCGQVTKVAVPKYAPEPASIPRR